MTAPVNSQGHQAARRAAIVVTPEATGAIPERMMAVEVAAHEDAQTGAGAAPGLLGDLQRHAVGRHDIVAADHAVGLDAEDLIEIYAPERHEGRGSLRRGPPQFGVEGGHGLIAQIAVRGGHGGDAGHPQLVDEAVLQGAVDPLAAAPRLRRVAEDVLDAEPGEGAADLGGWRRSGALPDVGGCTAQWARSV